MAKSVLVVGAGIVGLSIALQLQLRGWQVQLWDRQPAGEGTSYGNAGLIQREAVFPQPFPRDLHELWRYAGNRSSRAQYRFRALPPLAAAFLRYWRASRPDRLQRSAKDYGALIRHCLEDHLALAAVTDASELYRPGGWIQTFQTPEHLAAESAAAAYKKLHFDVEYALWDENALKQHLPMLRAGLAGAIHWTQPLALIEPVALSQAYLRTFQQQGGEFVLEGIKELEKTAHGWRIRGEKQSGEAPWLVFSMGAWTVDWAKRLGYQAPVFVKRGYHQHYTQNAEPGLPLPVLDSEAGYVLAPMRHGLRLTTGAEFAGRDDPPSLRQLSLAEAAARKLYPGLGRPLDPEPWLGHRPCTGDMLPIIGPLREQPGIFLAFGHCHQGLTMGPSTGRLVAQMLENDPHPFIDPRPYRPERFHD
ncbi:FAD-binding oxidoreductase [Acidithiobacillus sp. VAN18-1]|uniref:FAD-binding oxidoreductase n=1 Tax=Igneacidithiobacillus copahuensis TaxID=2724909 RepID=A0AAE2YMF8_9PROT|nr:FAD-dependent oxidoreductase [Igneacidithiobacillus copahuensis]MBU2786729.1 FAD-binding oxidoreductase [Igneacidithiobacillus copahuensis]MBU2795328.1 FAD-binding oxidoreductase [Acidithiobacillus sp. VAN18-2]